MFDITKSYFFYLFIFTKIYICKYLSINMRPFLSNIESLFYSNYKIK